MRTLHCKRNVQQTGFHSMDNAPLSDWTDFHSKESVVSMPVPSLIHGPPYRRDLISRLLGQIVTVARPLAVAMLLTLTPVLFVIASNG